MHIFDSHAHFDDAAFDEDRHDLLKAIHAEGVDFIANIGCDEKTNESSVKLAEQYDFIYADPPYDLEQLPTLPDLIFEQGILKEGGYFVLEHSKHNDFYNHPHFVEQRSYGSVHFSFFQ